MSPNNCWLANTVITIQSVYALLLNAVVLGIVFARISRPGQRVSAISHALSLEFSYCYSSLHTASGMHNVCPRPPPQPHGRWRCILTFRTHSAL